MQSWQRICSFYGRQLKPWVYAPQCVGGSGIWTGFQNTDRSLRQHHSRVQLGKSSLRNMSFHPLGIIQFNSNSMAGTHQLSMMVTVYLTAQESAPCPRNAFLTTLDVWLDMEYMALVEDLAVFAPPLGFRSKKLVVGVQGKQFRNWSPRPPPGAAGGVADEAVFSPRRSLGLCYA